MREMSSDLWLRRGSSIVYDRQLLAPLIASDRLVSLREALGWRRRWPDEPPGGGPTVLVAGLQTCLELLSAGDAAEFLRRQVKPFVIDFQSRWDQCGLVFGFGSHPKAFRVTTVDEEVEFVRTDQSVVRLSASLWNGSGLLDMHRISHRDPQSHQEVAAGFYVPRS